jgi:hypothetical protein
MAGKKLSFLLTRSEIIQINEIITIILNGMAST